MLGKLRLDNGLTYYILQNKKPADRAEFWLVVNVGAILEDDDQDGLAHFCEHMAFNGTAHFKKHQSVNYLTELLLLLSLLISKRMKFNFQPIVLVEHPCIRIKMRCRQITALRLLQNQGWEGLHRLNWRNFLPGKLHGLMPG
ncbi:MAG: insulinase family protein [Bacteroidetes bacterium]|nr:insulinase family protein [Bacteroidota bacterium]